MLSQELELELEVVEVMVEEVELEEVEVEVEEVEMMMTRCVLCVVTVSPPRVCIHHLTAGEDNTEPGSPLSLLLVTELRNARPGPGPVIDTG